MARLEGKVAVVTGAGGGIGLATAERFVAEGARVLLIDLNEGDLTAAVQQLGSAASRLVCDVSKNDSAATYVKTALERYGRLDIAVLNAGIEGKIGSIAELPVEEFDRVMSVNVRAVWLGLAALMPVMKDAGGGSIAITSSVGGFRGRAMIAPYTTSKHAVIGLMRAAALEGAAAKVRVNTIHPGPIDTRMMRAIEKNRAPDDPAARRKANEAVVPMQRYGTAEEVASLLLYLSSDEASFCTGGTYQVDGGSMAGPVAR